MVKNSVDSGGTNSNLALIVVRFRAKYQGNNVAGRVHNTKPPDIKNSRFAMVRWEGADPEVVDKEKQEDLAVSIRGKALNQTVLTYWFIFSLISIHLYQLQS